MSQVCIEELKKVSKDMGVKALPWALVFKPGQGKLVGLDIPPSKVKHLRHNLQIILHNPGHMFRTDPNGFVMAYLPSDKELQDTAASQRKAEAAALDSKQGTLFDHLLSSVLKQQPPTLLQQQHANSNGNGNGRNHSQTSLIEQMNELHQQQEQYKQPAAKDSWGASSNNDGNGNGKVQQQADCEITQVSEEQRQVSLQGSTHVCLCL